MVLAGSSVVFVLVVGVCIRPLEVEYAKLSLLQTERVVVRRHLYTASIAVVVATGHTMCC